MTQTQQNSTLRVDYVRIFESNYVWIASCDSQEGVVVFDPGHADEIVDFLHRHNKKIDSIFVTHSHWDHVTDLVKMTKDDELWLNPLNKRIVGPSSIKGVNTPVSDSLVTTLWRSGYLEVEVLKTPGHMPEHLCYYFPGDLRIDIFGFAQEPITAPMVICGDVLFSAGCGRIFKGTASELSLSLEVLSKLPSNTLMFCSHEYTLANIRFAQHIADNMDDSPEAQAYRESLRHYLTKTEAKLAAGQSSLPSTINTEREINPFLKCHTPHVKHAVEILSVEKCSTTLAVFTQLRRLKDNF